MSTFRKSLWLATLALGALTAQATDSDNWIIHARFQGSDVKAVADAGNQVYYLVSDNLFRFDKTTQENEALNKANYLNDASITGIYRNSDRDFLVIAYANSNIDVITGNGQVVNLPDLKAVEITGGKAINDVTFSGNQMIVATQFGYVTYNTTRWEVITSRNFGRNVASAAIVGGQLLLSVGGQLFYGSATTHYNGMADMDSTATLAGRLRPLSDSRLMQLGAGEACVSDVATDAQGHLTLTPATTLTGRPTDVQPTPSGWLVNFLADSCYYTLSSAGDNAQRHNGGGELFSSDPHGDGTLWSVGPRGLHSDKAPDTWYRPNGLSMGLPFHLVYNNAQRLLYVSSTGTNDLINYEYYPTAVNTFDGTTWRDVTPTPPISDGGTYYPVFSPDDPTTYFLSSWWNGLYKVTNGQVVANYNENNVPAPRRSSHYYQLMAGFDRNGNLWTFHPASERYLTDNVMVLPHAKVASNNVTTADWIKVAMPDLYLIKRTKFLFSRYNDFKIVANGDYERPITIFTDGGNPSGTIQYRTFEPSTGLTDQDGGAFKWVYVRDMVEDQNATVWLCTSSGVISFDPTKALNSDFTINHIKVPRNDGTNLADYLLDGQDVTCIAVDGANRKWLGTHESGLFLVSADGSSIIRQFNTSNSPILSNYIYKVCCDPNTGSVFITTDAGLMEYKATSGTSGGDMSNVYAYPNPVRPDYYGPITITGLTSNAHVKIADSGGNVIKQLKAENGEATWDGTVNGEPAKSGVYFILASDSDSSSSQNAVTKLLIMR